MNKQIEEMAQIIAKNVYGAEQDVAYAPNARNASKELFSIGYRRQEDVARKIIQVMDDMIEEPVSEWHRGYMDAIMDWKRAIKRKYGVVEDEQMD